MKSKPLIFLLILVFIKSLVWLVLTPVFQIPDEASHFSIVQFISHNHRRPHPRREQPTSKELLKVSEIVNFNWQIIHPVWQNYQQNWRQEISSISPQEKSLFQQNDYQTSIKRPPLYYWLATPFYLIFKNQPFLFRFFSVRFFSLIISLLIVYFSYKIAQLFFKVKSLSLAIAALVAFQPLFSFITTGVHYDPITILTSTFFLYSLTSYLQTKKSSWRHLSLVAALLGILIRPDLIVLLMFYPFILSKKARKTALLAGLIIIIALAAIFPLFQTAATQKHWLVERLPYIFSLNDYTYNLNLLFKYFFSGAIFTKLNQYLAVAKQSHLVQIFPWYWGVFGWLESTLPLWVYRVLKISILISFLGWLKLFITRRSTLKLSTSTKKLILFFFSFSFIHFAVVVLNDFIPFVNSGNIFGIQGRYLLPAITAHMLLLVFGWCQLINKKYHQQLGKLIFLLAISLNLIGLKTLFQFFGWVW